MLSSRVPVIDGRHPNERSLWIRRENHLSQAQDAAVSALAGFLFRKPLRRLLRLSVGPTMHQFVHRKALDCLRGFDDP